MSVSTMMAVGPSTVDSRAPSPIAQDSLEDLEMSALGVATALETLPAPPIEVQPLGASKKSSGGVATPPVGRAKRPKNTTESTTGNTGTTREAPSQPNNDFCSACGGRGQFLCCDGGCLRSFHFNCLDPPLGYEELPDESWFCKICRADQDPPVKSSRGIFRDLIHRVECENPKAFALPVEIKAFFKEVGTGPIGDFIDTKEHRLPSKITGKAVGQEDRDGYRVKDKTGKTMLCYQCNQAASSSKQRRIISCDFCDQHWHLDCLDPPMTGMPPPTRKWMCPVHSDNAIPRIRQPKATTMINVSDRGSSNNGDIVIIPRREVERIADDYDEVTVNRVRYQIPEDTVILDFFGKISGGSRTTTIRNPINRNFFDNLSLIQPNGSYENTGSLSPLTSLDELSSDEEDCENDQNMMNPGPSVLRRHTPSALDDLALLADGYHASLEFDREKTRAALDLASSVAGESSNGPRLGSNGLVVTLSARSGTNETSKGKGRAMDFDAGGEEIEREAKRLKASNTSPSSSRAAPTFSILSHLPLNSTLPNNATFNSIYSDSQRHPSHDNLTQIAPIPPYRPTTNATLSFPTAHSNIAAAPQHTPIPTADVPAVVTMEGLAALSGRGIPPAELMVSTKDDLKALTHVRKLMSAMGDDALDPEMRSVMIQFLQGGAVLPKLEFIQPQSQIPAPWNRPWEADVLSTTSDVMMSSGGSEKDIPAV